jgi:RNA polymerase sigma factor (sigma-70 family)
VKNKDVTMKPQDVMDGLPPGLLHDYIPLAATYVRRYQALNWWRNDDFDDLFQELMIALIEATRTYNPDKHDTFGYWAKKLMRQRLSKFLFRSRRISVSEQLVGDLLDPVDLEELGQIDSVESVFDLAELTYSVILVVEFAQVLTPRQRLVLSYLLRGYTQRQIALELHSSEANISGHLGAIRMRCRKFAATRKLTGWLQKIATEEGGASAANT